MLFGKKYFGSNNWNEAFYYFLKKYFAAKRVPVTSYILPTIATMLKIIL